ncbi:ABC transporter ATP-binding protein [Micromonospora sp. LOL_023]|uniref:ABC transporter ATP-binding protein n=1 Tax=Micromonospora sp. LOL_023 TaxID=3345418 RepID=UPI003A8AB1CF
MTDQAATPAVAVRSPVLELAGVSKRYPGPPAVDALRDVTLSVHPGEMVAISGPSGSGKSTLLNILGLLDTPTSGTHLLAGRPTNGLRERELTRLRASSIGFVFQSFHLVPYLDSVRNVALPLIHQGRPRRARRDLAVAALASVGLGHRLYARPTTMSGGEQQRVAIARAIVHEPALLLCDEPTGNLDSTNTDTVLRLLRGLVVADRAVVVVTHDARVEQSADRVIRVVDGRAS